MFHLGPVNPQVACNNFPTYIAMMDTKDDIKAAGSKD